MLEVIDKFDAIFVHGLINSGIAIIFSFLVAKILLSFILRVIDGYIQKEKRDKDMSFLLLKKVLKVIIYLVAFMIASQEIIPLKNLGTALLGVSGAFTVVVALGTQEVAENLVAGVSLSIYQPFKKGDQVRINSEGIAGVIEDLNLRHCIIKSFENSKIIVPNKIMSNAIVENRQFDKDNPYLNTFFYSISYDSDFERAKTILSDYMKGHPSCILKEEVSVCVFELKDSAVELRVRAYSKDQADGLKLKTDLNEFVLKKFKEEGIEIPFPTMNIIKHSK